jgi:hypothetical protein
VDLDEFFASLPGGAFRHRDHVRLAWLAVRETDEPVRTVREAIRGYAAAHGAAAKYHETLTAFWVRLVAHCVAARPGLDDFEEFVAAFPLLLDKAIAERHWSAGALWSAEARAAWREPDLLPMPS